jgi:hypothetical protein
MVIRSPSDDAILATLYELLEAGSMTHAASILKSAEASIQKTGYDNWNGGTDIYTLFLSIEPSKFAQLSYQRAAIEQQLSDQVQVLFRDGWITAEIRPRIQGRDNWRNSGATITKITRRKIADYFVASSIAWSGDLSESDFLGRIYDMGSIPSRDSRFKTADGDIHQHRVNNDDWPDDWIFDDDRFDLKRSDEKLLLFLAESLHPVVRPDEEACTNLLAELNKFLQRDGWELVETASISGHPIYGAQQVHSGARRAMNRARVVADALDASWMRGEIQRLEKAVDTDPSLAVGTAKDLVETCCKTILVRRKVEIPKSADLPKIVRLVATELKLVPDGISEAAKGANIIKGILTNLASLTHGLAELRGLYGSGHGRDGKHLGVGPRHARLAVATAVAFIDFVTETYHERDK